MMGLRLYAAELDHGLNEAFVGKKMRATGTRAAQPRYSVERKILVVAAPVVIAIASIFLML